MFLLVFAPLSQYRSQDAPCGDGSGKLKMVAVDSTPCNQLLISTRAAILSEEAQSALTWVDTDDSDSCCGGAKFQHPSSPIIARHDATATPNYKCPWLCPYDTTCTACGHFITELEDAVKHPTLEVLVCRECATQYIDEDEQKQKANDLAQQNSQLRCAWCYRLKTIAETYAGDIFSSISSSSIRQVSDVDCSTDAGNDAGSDNVATCSECARSFCFDCIARNFGPEACNKNMFGAPSSCTLTRCFEVYSAAATTIWKCCICNPILLEG